MRSCSGASSSRFRRATLGGCSKEADLKPHLIRYWLTPAADEPPEERDERIADVCATYQEARTRASVGERVISTDEMTGVQALERAAPGLPLRPGKVERREFEYIRHGTLSFMINFDVVTGQVICPSLGPTRTEADFLANIRGAVQSDPSATQWHFVSDNLNTHCSESLVHYVAEVSGITDDLGIKEKCGVLKSMATRAAFLSNASHKVVFHYTPKHASWLNQVELWLSILVRKLLRRGNFTSTDDLRNKVLDFISYFNRTMAKPFKWTYLGKPQTKTRPFRP
jgi:transposase